MKVAAFLPVKGHSERIENKNISLLGNKPLFHWMLESLLKCKNIDEVYLDTESQQVIDLAYNYKCKIFRRDSSLADNKTDGNKLFYNEASKIKADIYVMALCTSPFLKAETIDEGIKFLIKHKEYDSVVAVFNDKQYTWNEKFKTNYNLDKIPNSKDLTNTIIETMGLYIVRNSVVLKNKRRIGEKPYLMNISRQESFDINFPEDMNMANKIANGILIDNYKRNRMYSLFLNTAIISDAMDNLKITGRHLSNKFISNFNNAKFCGNIRTISIKKLINKKDTKKIYDGLPFLEKLSLGDVLMVSNEIPKCAYFGELMSTLAIKQGLSGAVIDGFTRDNDDTVRLDFPVFAKGRFSLDTKYKAYIHSVDHKIQIDGIDIYPGDFVFADADSIIILDKNEKARVLEEALKIYKNETMIKNDILSGLNVENLMKRHGMF